MNLSMYLSTPSCPSLVIALLVASDTQAALESFIQQELPDTVARNLAWSQVTPQGRWSVPGAGDCFRGAEGLNQRPKENEGLQVDTGWGIQVRTVESKGWQEIAMA